MTITGEWLSFALLLCQVSWVVCFLANSNGRAEESLKKVATAEGGTNLLPDIKDWMTIWLLELKLVLVPGAEK